jgi:hypothetical protein
MRWGATQALKVVALAFGLACGLLVFLAVVRGALGTGDEIEPTGMSAVLEGAMSFAWWALFAVTIAGFWLLVILAATNLWRARRRILLTGIAGLYGAVVLGWALLGSYGDACSTMGATIYLGFLAASTLALAATSAAAIPADKGAKLATALGVGTLTFVVALFVTMGAWFHC